MGAIAVRSEVRQGIVCVVACLAVSLHVGAAYTLVAQTLEPFTTIRLSGYWFVVITGLGTLALGVAIGHERPRLVIGSSFIVAILSSVVYGVVLALPGLLLETTNIVGLVNYALTQASVTFFIVLFVAFPGVIVGLLVSYWWQYR